MSARCKSCCAVANIVSFERCASIVCVKIPRCSHVASRLSQSVVVVVVVQIINQTFLLTATNSKAGDTYTERSREPSDAGRRFNRLEDAWVHTGRCFHRSPGNMCSSTLQALTSLTHSASKGADAKQHSLLPAWTFYTLVCKHVHSVPIYRQTNRLQWSSSWTYNIRRQCPYSVMKVSHCHEPRSRVTSSLGIVIVREWIRFPHLN